MNRVKIYRALTVLSVPFAIIILYIVIFIKPGIIIFDPSMKIFFFWFILFSCGSAFMNLRQISIMCMTKEEKHKNEIFSSKGRYILRNNPKTYFNDEILAKYKMHQRLYVIYFTLMFVLLYFLWNSDKRGIHIPFLD